MYSDLIDNARTPDSDISKRSLAEIYLFQTILEGKHPTLVLPQTFDSDLILSLIKSCQRDSFLSAFQKGYIRISPFNGSLSMQEYLLKILEGNITDSTLSFYFSCFPFLYDGRYKIEEQKQIFAALKKQISNGRAKISCDLLSEEERSLFDEYAEIIYRLNLASNRSFLPSNKTPHSLKQVVTANIEDHLHTLNSNAWENEELLNAIPFYQQLVNDSVWNRRTEYYNYLSEQSSYYPASILEEARKLIDLSYNETVASSLSDTEGGSSNIPDTLPALTTTAISQQETRRALQTTITAADRANISLSWSDLLVITEELSVICREKNCAWEEALRIYSARQQRLPFVLSAKYGVITGATYALSSIPLVGTFVSNVTSELLWSAATDALGECMQKPSFHDIKEISANAKKNCRLLKILGSTTSVNRRNI